MRDKMKKLLILTVSSYLLGFDVNWSGNVGGFIVQSKFSGQSDNFSVQSAEIGLSLILIERSETSLKLLFFDLLPGSVYYNEVTPFLSEAFVSFPVYPNSPLSFKLGRQRFTYGDGLLLFDYWIGEDALKLIFEKENLGIEGFYIRVVENFVTGYRYDTDSVGKDQDIIGFYGNYDRRNISYEGFLIKGVGYINEPLWFETRLIFENPELRVKANGVLLLEETEENQFAFALTARRNFNTTSLGIGYFYFSSKWFNPLGYAYVHDDFYNGWGAGFGEVIPWAILPWSSKGNVISDLVTDPGAIFWINPHNLSVLNINIAKNFGEKISFRMDAFLYKLIEAEKRKFGKELTFNLNYLAPGDVDFGLSLGLFKPGDYFEKEFDAMVVKIWFLKNFSF